MKIALMMMFVGAAGPQCCDDERGACGARTVRSCQAGAEPHGRRGAPRRRDPCVMTQRRRGHDNDEEQRAHRPCVAGNSSLLQTAGEESGERERAEERG
jgi:hypothetical protein